MHLLLSFTTLLDYFKGQSDMPTKCGIFQVQRKNLSISLPKFLTNKSLCVGICRCRTSESKVLGKPFNLRHCSYLTSAHQLISYVCWQEAPVASNFVLNPCHLKSVKSVCRNGESEDSSSLLLSFYFRFVST